MDVYRRTVFQVRLRAHFPSCAKTDCETFLIFSISSLRRLRADICVSSWTTGLISCNKPEVWLKLSDYQAVKPLPSHTHMYMRRHTLAVPASQGEQGSHMFEGWLTPGRWFALGTLWSLNLFRSVCFYSLIQTHTGMLMFTDTNWLSRLAKQYIVHFCFCFLNFSY